METVQEIYMERVYVRASLYASHILGHSYDNSNRVKCIERPFENDHCCIYIFKVLSAFKVDMAGGMNNNTEN